MFAHGLGRLLADPSTPHLITHNFFRNVTRSLPTNRRALARARILRIDVTAQGHGREGREFGWTADVAAAGQFQGKEISMNANVGTVDQALRVLAGLLLVILAATGVIGIWGYIGLLVAATGVFAYCPAYSVFGISTCRRPK